MNRSRTSETEYPSGLYTSWRTSMFAFALVFVSAVVAAQTNPGKTAGAQGRLVQSDFSAVHLPTGAVIQYGEPGLAVSAQLGNPDRRRIRPNDYADRFDLFQEWYSDLVLQYSRGETGIGGASFYSSEFVTPRGVTVGTTLADVVDAYGLEQVRNGSMTYWLTLPDERTTLFLVFFLYEGLVTDFAFGFAYP